MNTFTANHCIDASTYAHYSQWLALLNIDLWPRWVAFIFVVMPYVLMFVDFVLVQYIVVRHWDKMVEALKNSQDFRWIHGSPYYMGGRERRSKTGQIAIAVTWPKMLIQAGKVDEDDIKNFPAHLKRLLQIFVWIGLVGLGWALVSYLILKMR